MKPDLNDAELLTRWIDGELDATGRVALDASLDPARRAGFDAELAAANDLGDLLRDVYPAARDVAGPELFMHQLAHRLDRAEEPALTPVAPARVLPMAGWLAAAAALALGLFAAGRMLPRAPADALATAAPIPQVPAATALLASYVPDPSVRMDARYNADVDAVVIVLDGLQPIGTPEELVGFQADDPQPGKLRLAGQAHQHRFRGGPSDS